MPYAWCWCHQHISLHKIAIAKFSSRPILKDVDHFRLIILNECKKWAKVKFLLPFGFMTISLMEWGPKCWTSIHEAFWSKRGLKQRQCQFLKSGRAKNSRANPTDGFFLNVPVLVHVSKLYIKTTVLSTILIYIVELWSLHQILT